MGYQFNPLYKKGLTPNSFNSITTQSIALSESSYTYSSGTYGSTYASIPNPDDIPLVVQWYPQRNSQVFNANGNLGGYSSVANTLQDSSQGERMLALFNGENALGDVPGGIPCLGLGMYFQLPNTTLPSPWYYPIDGAMISWLGSTLEGSGNGRLGVHVFGNTFGPNTSVYNRCSRFGLLIQGNGTIRVGYPYEVNYTLNRGAEPYVAQLDVNGSGSFKSDTPSGNALTLSGSNSQSANLLQVNNYYGTQLAAIDAQGSLHVASIKSSCLTLNNTSANTTYTVPTTYSNIFTTGNYTLSLPDATTNLGMELTIIKKDTNTTTQTITCLITGQTINGQSSLVITAQYNSVTLLSDGSNWYIK